ncbi:MAG: FAD-binding protein, partial [Dethiobacteria bacterium]
GIEFSVVELVQLMQEHGRNINDRKLLRSFAENTGQAVSWLENEWGFTFKLSSIDKPHLHLPEPELNAALFVDTLQHGLLSRININEHFFSGELEKVSRLNKGQGFKVFISTEEKQIELFVRALLFADGGFAGNEQLLTEFAPGQSGLRTDLRPDSTGKGLLFLKEADADLLQLDLIDAVPVYVEDGRFMLFQPPSEAYYLNSYGELIAEDEDGAQQLRRLIYSQPNRTVYLVVNDEVLPHQLRFANFFRPLLTFEQLAEYMKLEEEKAELLERNLRSLKVPFWVAKTELAVKYTLGGVKISPKGEVISGGRPLPGVFAAGEIIGGLHGERILEGAALSEAVVTARIAAKAAAEWARR